MFPAEGIQFLRDLSSNNNRDWFQAHKKDFEACVQAPASQLAEEIAQRLGERLQAEIGYKVFRIYRDVRFSKDKTPYNTHMRFGFWEQGHFAGKPMTGPAFYLSIEPEMVHVGAGCIMMPAGMLAGYRSHVSANGSEVSMLMARLETEGARFDPSALKRVPKGYDSDHPQAPLLRRKGLTCWFDQAIVAKRNIEAPEILRKFRSASPIYEIVKTF